MRLDLITFARVSIVHLVWELDGTAFYASLSVDKMLPLKLIVEQLPGQDRWDWAAWGRDLPIALRKGEARSASDAMRAAEAWLSGVTQSVRVLD
jgi:hypothetical protein